MPNCNMNRLEGAVAGQPQGLVRWLAAWRVSLPGRELLDFKVDTKWCFDYKLVTNRVSTKCWFGAASSENNGATARPEAVRKIIRDGNGARRIECLLTNSAL